ncbi:MAG: hypothetical protein ABI183_26430 [Polyangiaceae bacterium]
MKRRAFIASITFVVPALAAIGVAACSGSSSGDDSSISSDSGSQTDSTVAADTGPINPNEAGVDAGPKKYCASDSFIVDAGPDADAIAPAVPQQFDSKMAGCPGIVGFVDRASLCGPTCTPCGAEDWVNHHGSTPPLYNYWTNDDLGYNGGFASGETCSASLIDDAAAPQPPYICDEPFSDGGTLFQPMRVCANHSIVDVEAPFGTQSDPLGNTCNWGRCAFSLDGGAPDYIDAGIDAAPPVFDYLGGCSDNLTAGTLCCCE